MCIALGRSLRGRFKSSTPTPITTVLGPWPPPSSSPEAWVFVSLTKVYSNNGRTEIKINGSLHEKSEKGNVRKTEMGKCWLGDVGCWWLQDHKKWGIKIHNFLKLWNAYCSIKNLYITAVSLNKVAKPKGLLPRTTWKPYFLFHQLFVSCCCLLRKKGFIKRCFYDVFFSGVASLIHHSNNTENVNSSQTQTS